MYLRLTCKLTGEPVIVNSDDISTCRPVVKDGNPMIFFRTMEIAPLETVESFEQIATLLNAQAPESVGTVPAIHNVLISAAIGGGDDYQKGLSQVGIFDANKVTSVRTLTKNTVEFKRGYETAFGYEGKTYYSSEVFETLMTKIGSVMGK